MNNDGLPPIGKHSHGRESSLPCRDDATNGARAFSPRVFARDTARTSPPSSAKHMTACHVYNGSPSRSDDSTSGARAFSPRVFAGDTARTSPPSSAKRMTDSHVYNGSPSRGDDPTTGARAFSPRVFAGGSAAVPRTESRESDGRNSPRRPPHGDLELQPYFVTTRLRRGRPLLVGETAETAVDELFAQRERHQFLLLAFVFMPDHAHFVVVPLKGYSIAQTMRVIKGGIARRVNTATGGFGALWQSGFFDKSPKDTRALNTFIKYTEWNPVRSGLSMSPSQYRYSSAGDRCVHDYHAFFAMVQADR